VKETFAVLDAELDTETAHRAVVLLAGHCVRQVQSAYRCGGVTLVAVVGESAGGEAKVAPLPVASHMSLLHQPAFLAHSLSASAEGSHSDGQLLHFLVLLLVLLVLMVLMVDHGTRSSQRSGWRGG